MSPSVLIVDDSKSVSSVLKQYLIELGLDNISVCDDPLLALSQIKNDLTAFDAVFIDLHMPGLDGLEMMHQLDNLNYRGGVIIISGLDQKIIDLAENIIKTTQMKLLGTATKPFSLSVLAFLVKRIRYIRNKAYPKADFIKRRELVDSLKNKYIVPYYQPKINCRFDTMLGVECLARIDVTGRGRISPDNFIPVAEKFGLYDEFFELLLHQALKDYVNFSLTHNTKSPLSINILPNQLNSDKLLYQIDNAIEKSLFPIEMLMLEITEHQALHTQAQLKNLNRLRINGIKLSLDDYGAGFTNLGQIKNLPLNEVKLDAKMVNGIALDPLLEVICRSTQEVTSALGLQFIAEGVESEKDLAVLEKLGVDGFQGYGICRPKPIDEFERWFQVWNRESESSRYRN